MGPQPPLKRRPTHTPYTRPCKRDISAKLTPAGVGACTHTARSKKPSYHPPCGYIYIYTRAHRYRGHESIPHCHKSRHISTITDSFPPCVLRGLPTGIRPCFPRIFSVSNFSTLSLSAARSLFHLDASASFPPPVSHTRPSNRLREIQFRRFSWLTLSLSLYLWLSLVFRSKTHLLFPAKLSTRRRTNFPKCLLEMLRTFLLDLLSPLAIGVKLHIARYIFTKRARRAAWLAVAFARDTPLRWTNVWRGTFRVIVSILRCRNFSRRGE